MFLDLYDSSICHYGCVYSYIQILLVYGFVDKWKLYTTYSKFKCVPCHDTKIVVFQFDYGASLNL